MGEARRKKLSQSTTPAMTIAAIDDRVDLARVTSAIRRLSEAASSHLGSDCYLHAALCRELLKGLGVDSRIVVGFASWRVGTGDGDVISHLPQKGVPLQPNAAPYHAWLEIGEPTSQQRILLDFTLYQLPRKAAALDAMDGGKTSVTWCPDYLATQYAKVSTMHQVAQDDAGLFFYEQNAQVAAVVTAVLHPIDPDDVAALRLLYENPDMLAVGPNQTGPL